MHAQTSPRRLLFLSILAALLGAAGGGAAWVLLHLIGLLTNFALFHRYGWELPSFRTLAASPWIVVAAVVGALLVSLLAKWSPVIRGHGIPEAMEAVLTAAEPDLAAGGAGQAAVGGDRHRHRRTVRRRGADHRHRRRAGVAGGAGAPRLAGGAQDPARLRRGGGHVGHLRRAARLGGAGHRAAAVRVLDPGVRAAGGGGERGGGRSTRRCSARGRCSPCRRTTTPASASLPLFVVLGVACGLLAVVVSKGLFLVEDGFRRLPVSEFWHPVIGALGFSHGRSAGAARSRRRLRRDRRRAQRPAGDRR